MSTLIAKLLRSSRPARIGFASTPPSAETGFDAGSGLDDTVPQIVSKLAGAVRSGPKRWLWSSASAELEISRANLTHIEELILNLP